MEHADVLEVSNQTKWASGLYPGWSVRREYQMTLVIKASYRFELDGQITAKAESKIIENDVHYGKAHESSLAQSSEIVPFKSGGEIYLSGTAHPPKTGAVVMEVGMTLRFINGREWKKRLRIMGPREWKRKFLRSTYTEPAPLEPVALRYENAFGGRHADSGEVYMANPAGMGFNRGQWRVDDVRLPLIEQAPAFMCKPSQRPAPAGFAPLPVFWSPRMEAIGEGGDGAINDDAAPAEQSPDSCPYPENMQAEAWNAAPVDQRFDTPFSAGDRVHLQGFFAKHTRPVELILPELPFAATLFCSDRQESLAPVLDTVVIDTDTRELHLIYRTGIAWARRSTAQACILIEARPTASGERSGADTLTQPVAVLPARFEAHSP